MSTYPPRECGLATFTKDLVTAFKKEFSPEYKSKIIAMEHGLTKNAKYPEEVILKLNQIDIKDYVKNARKINKIKTIKLVCIQHEFGIFGGKYLNYLSGFLEIIEKPVVITLHSVVPNPKDSIKSTIQYLAKKSSCLVVMAEKAIEILRSDYEIKNTKIELIHHGIHEVPYEPSIVAKTKFGYKDKLVLSSFGLISSKKHYEDIIKAMPVVVKKFPNLLYLIIGITHPSTIRKEGEKYRNHLKKLIKKLNLHNNVKFVDKYLPLPELLEYLKASDIFVSSGKDLNQITSGTLVYALSCGRPVITHPFLHAKEAVTKDRGILVKLGDSKSYAKAITKLLSTPKLRDNMGKNAYKYTRKMLWSNVAKSYMKVFKRYI